MTLHEIRMRFLSYMERNGHVVIASSRLVPDNDPTTLFTGSGMQPMLPYLLGAKHPLGELIADSQKCFRSQDIEEVGDNRHTTFFEMLGNWSLGNFFKETQIPLMYNFLTEEIGLPSDRLYFSCFIGSETVPRDTFSAELWQTLIINKENKLLDEVRINEDPLSLGIRSGDRIFYYNDKKNWWSRSGVPSNMPLGEPGGPDTEMFYDFFPSLGRSCIQGTPFSGEFCHPNCDCGRFVEIGNNVFMQYKKVENGFEELPQMNVDFGGGLERIAAASQNNSDVFMLDVFEGPRKTLVSLGASEYGSSDVVTYAYRVILDHVRAATFLISDGVYPGNKDQQYFVRRLIRRAVRFGAKLGVNESFAHEVAKSYIDYYKELYSNLSSNESDILKAVTDEESKFRKTVLGGIKQFEKFANKDISGEDAFDLLQSYGFPFELTCEMASERGLAVDKDRFNALKSAHQLSSRSASATKFKGGLGSDGEMEVKYHTATHLLHQALRTVLGEDVVQKGSNITSERLRFDFSFNRKVTEVEQSLVAQIVNDAICAAHDVVREETTLESARSRGAIGLFGDKYGETVSVYSIGKQGKSRGEEGVFSLEFCGGPHVANTSILGHFKIIKEEAVSDGVRRIKAVLE